MCFQFNKSIGLAYRLCSKILENILGFKLYFLRHSDLARNALR